MIQDACGRLAALSDMLPKSAMVTVLTLACARTESSSNDAAEILRTSHKWHTAGAFGGAHGPAMVERNRLSMLAWEQLAPHLHLQSRPFSVVEIGSGPQQLFKHTMRPKAYLPCDQSAWDNTTLAVDANSDNKPSAEEILRRGSSKGFDPEGTPLLLIVANVLPSIVDVPGFFSWLRTFNASLFLVQGDYDVRCRSPPPKGLSPQATDTYYFNCHTNIRNNSTVLAVVEAAGFHLRHSVTIAEVSPGRCGEFCDYYAMGFSTHASPATSTSTPTPNHPHAHAHTHPSPPSPASTPTPNHAHAHAHAHPHAPPPAPAPPPPPSIRASHAEGPLDRLHLCTEPGHDKVTGLSCP